MNLIRKNYNVWDPFSLVEDMDKILSAPVLRRGETRGLFVPDIDFREEGNQYVIKADVPGIQKENLDITLTGNVLTLRGERKGESEVKEKGYTHSERWSGSFERTVEFPDEVDAAGVKAVFKDGVLELTVPKSATAKPRQIKVEVK